MPSTLHYAAAIARCARGDSGALERWGDALTRVARAVDTDPDVHRFFNDRAGNPEAQETIFRHVFGATLDEPVYRFLHILSQHRAFRLLPEITEALSATIDAQSGIVRVAVETAVTLDETRRTSLEQTLRERLGTTIAATYAVVPERLGGIRITVSGSRQWEWSVESAFCQLERHLAPAV